MLSNTVVSAIVVFSSVCGFVVADTNGSEGIPNEEEWYYYPEAINVTSTLTTKDVEKLINDSRAFTRRQFLADPRLKNIIVDNFKVLVATRLECVAKELHYYDFEIPDCKSCLRIDCDIDVTCRAECSGMLEMKRQKQALNFERNGSEQLRIMYQQLVEKQDADKTLLLGFIVVIVVAFVVVFVFLAVIYKKLNEPNKPRLVTAEQSETDVTGAKQPMMAATDSDSGHGSVPGLQPV